MSHPCPTCGATARVATTRPNGGLVRRRYKCPTSRAHAFSTVEFTVEKHSRFVLHGDLLSLGTAKKIDLGA